MTDRERERERERKLAPRGSSFPLCVIIIMTTNQNNTNTLLRDNEKPSNCEEERERNSSSVRVPQTFFSLSSPLLQRFRKATLEAQISKSLSPPKRAKALKKAGFLKKAIQPTTSKKKAARSLGRKRTPVFKSRRKRIERIRIPRTRI